MKATDVAIVAAGGIGAGGLLALVGKLGVLPAGMSVRTTAFVAGGVAIAGGVAANALSKSDWVHELGAGAIGVGGFMLLAGAMFANLAPPPAGQVASGNLGWHPGRHGAPENWHQMHGLVHGNVATPHPPAQLRPFVAGHGRSQPSHLSGAGFQHGPSMPGIPWGYSLQPRVPGHVPPGIARASWVARRHW
jgi:hypothetical protein